jgi:DNA-directed RNA polymerase specialized sigma24 family protein
MPFMPWNRKKKKCWQRCQSVMEYTNSEITEIINEYIHNERNRKLLLRRYVDGITLESLSEEFDLSVRQVKNIIYGNEDVIFKHLDNKKAL